MSNQKLKIIHPVFVLKSIRSERDVILQKGATFDLDRVTKPILNTLRNSWKNDPLSMGGDIIYLFNQNLPRKISKSERETPSKY